MLATRIWLIVSKVGHRERAGLDPRCLLHLSPALLDTEHQLHWKWVAYKSVATTTHTAECQDVSKWKVCCGGQTLSFQDICRDVGLPFCSRLAAAPQILQMLIYSVQTRRNVSRFQGMLIAAFTFPLAQCYSLQILGKLKYYKCSNDLYS